MIGVVVWVDMAFTKAVIWCEDQRDLAYYLAADSHDEGLICFQRGDVVEFELCDASQLRMAQNLRVVHTQTDCELATSLQHHADTAHPEDDRAVQAATVKARLLAKVSAATGKVEPERAAPAHNVAKLASSSKRSAPINEQGGDVLNFPEQRRA